MAEENRFFEYDDKSYTMVDLYINNIQILRVCRFLQLL